MEIAIQCLFELSTSYHDALKQPVNNFLNEFF